MKGKSDLELYIYLWTNIEENFLTFSLLSFSFVQKIK